MDDGVQLPKGYGHFKEAVYFLLTSAQKDERLSWCNCDDPSGVFIPSTTRYSQLYWVEPSYTE